MKRLALVIVLGCSGGEFSASVGATVEPEGGRGATEGGRASTSGASGKPLASAGRNAGGSPMGDAGMPSGGEPEPHEGGAAGSDGGSSGGAALGGAGGASPGGSGGLGGSGGNLSVCPREVEMVWKVSGTACQCNSQCNRSVAECATLEGKSCMNMVTCMPDCYKPVPDFCAPGDTWRIEGAACVCGSCVKSPTGCKLGRQCVVSTDGMTCKEAC